MGRGVWAWQTIGECVVSAVKYIIIRSISWNEAQARIETGNCRLWIPSVTRLDNKTGNLYYSNMYLTCSTCHSKLSISLRLNLPQLQLTSDPK